MTRIQTYPPSWPRCPSCGDPALDGHITCGRAMCDEAGERDRVVQDAIRAAQVYPDDGVDDLLDSQTGMTEDERRWIG